MINPVAYLVNLVRDTGTELARGIAEAVPRLVSGMVFLALAYLVIRIVVRLVSSALTNLYPESQELIARLWVTIVGVFLWFGAALALLKILGMGDVAASLGTATGFLALGVSYALSEMIEDAVAGVYLLRDPDFNPGDRVNTQSISGTVQSIELRKSRIELDDGDVVVIANRDVEKRWTRESA